MSRRFLVLHFLFVTISSSKAQQNLCPSSSCGNIRNISYPFRLETDPKNCPGQTWHELSCENNATLILTLNSAVKYIVKSINYEKKVLRIVDPYIIKENCTSLPRHSLTTYNFTHWSHPDERVLITGFTYSAAESVVFMRCENPTNSSLYIDTTASCGKNDSNNSYFYAMVDGSSSVRDIPSSCRVEVMTMVPRMRHVNLSRASYLEIHDALAYGVELVWFPDQNHFSGRDILEKIRDFFNDYYYLRALGILILILIALVLGARFVFGAPFVITLLIYKWRRRHLSIYDRIEEFLQSYHNLVPIRYSYSEIKKMTKGFEEKLGEGGYGSVYKGKLRSNHLVAIKILSGSKGNGEDFINEVATIGRIHHVNVVKLIGFCVEGTKRALVYDYMPKGSLDKHIFRGEGVDKSLSSKKMFKISLGVARGIEYLHKGCGMQILHFDIKPHNILLDENFVPKVSDFGLARSCPLDHNTVTLTAARGTLGYIAPELFYKNIGGVSYKADVYSFGMLLMEMASQRKNVNSSEENSSKVHFPTWVSNQFSEGNDIDLGVFSDEESKIIKKMMIVALWCIQFNPSDRPSMSIVVEMLEDEIEAIQMPPTKFTFYPKEEVSEDRGGESSSDWWSYSSSTIQSRDSSTTHSGSGQIEKN